MAKHTAPASAGGKSGPHAGPARGGGAAQPAAEPVSSKPVKVRAVRLGYFGNARRRPGDVFTVPAHMFSERWMERVAPDTPERATTPREALRREHADILKGATPPKAPIPGEDAPTGDLNPLEE